jgi:2-deoxystreptamine N-acetyl-D-glucosaminyltransferase/2-deoxystreptamine glucosyltransferase
VRVAVLTTSYPRHPDDHAGRFIADAVERLRGRGVEIDVLAPGAFDDHGLAYGDGVVRNLRRRPWAGPRLLASMARAAKDIAPTVDLIHAHWLPAGAAAARSGKPFVVTLHGTDVALARRVPWPARRILGRAAAVICVSRALAADAARLGARRIEVIANGVDVPEPEGREAVPPEVLFVGRLSPEKGVEELVAASRGLNLVVVGDGPLRDRVPGALGVVSSEERDRLYSRAAIVVCPSRREGFGMACAEAMAHGKPVVASAVGGLLDLVVDGQTGLLVEPRNPPALRAAIERLLANEALRNRLGAAARARVAELCSWPVVIERTLSVYREALGAKA